MPLLNPSTRSRLLAVGLPFFRSDARRRAYLGLATLVALLLAINGLNVVNSYVGRDFMSALAERDAPRFYALAAALAGVFAASTVVEVLARYAEQWLGLEWRQWLTRRLVERYLAGRSYLRLLTRTDIDNPDQRVSEDVRTFSATALSIFVLVVNGLLTLAAFSGVLWSITPWLFLTAVAYAAAGSIGTVLIGRRLVRLNNQQLQREADFRFALGRVREHAAEVAQVAGEPTQQEALGRRLGRVVENFRALIGLSRNLGFFTTLYGYLPQIIPAAVVAPLYVRGDVEFGTVTQAAMAFAQVQGAFSIVVSQFGALSTFAAVVGRLGTLWEATEPGLPAPPVPVAPPVAAPAAPAAPAAAAPVIDQRAGGDRLGYDHLTLWTPEGERPLVRDLSLEVPAGKRLAVTGPCGAGKTALLLATAGLWLDGRGRVVRPGPDAVRFLPQRPCLPPGRLRDVLACDAPDDRIRAVLHDLGLDPILQRSGGPDAERDWSRELAPPEQWALAAAGLLLAGPRFAFLAAPDDAVPAPVAERVYRALARSSITYVTVGCDGALLAYHDLCLALLGNGEWRLAPRGAPPS